MDGRPTPGELGSPGAGRVQGILDGYGRPGTADHRAAHNY
jgi:hypothetical protein